MTAYTLPQDGNKVPKVLLAGDTLDVNNGGTSRDITIQDEAIENVNTGGKALNTTVNDGGLLKVFNGGTIDQTTVNGGLVVLTNATADHTTLNFSLQFPSSELDAHDGSVVKNTVITGGNLFSAQHGLLVDATSTAENVEFRGPNDPHNKFSGGAGIALENPLSLKGDIKGISVGDFIQFGIGSV